MTRRATWAAIAGFVLGLPIYLFLTGASTASAVAYLLAVGLSVGAWRLEARSPRQGWIKLVGVILAALVLVGGKGWRGTIPWQFLLFTLVTILIYVLFSVSLNLEFGFGGLINFGHVAFMSIGAYIVAMLTAKFGLLTSQAGILLAMGLAVLGAGAAGLLLALPAIRLREDYLAIVSIAGAEILRRVLINEQAWTGGPRGISVPGAFKPLQLAWIEALPGIGPWLHDGLFQMGAVLGFTGSPYLLVVLFLGIVFALGAILVVQRLVDSPWGRALRAIREDEDAVRSLGINPVVYKLQVFALGSAIAAVAGCLWTWHLAFISPGQFEPLRTFWAWIMIVIGGIGDNKGAVAGAFIFFTINEITRGVERLRAFGLDSEQVAAFAPLALGALLVAFMLTKPEGIFGNREELELVE